MTTNTTNEQLIKIAISNDEFEKKYPGIAMFLKPKLREFYNQNGVRISSVMERAEAIDRKYHERDETGTMILRDGMSKKDWEEESEKFLKEEVRLTF